jgi:hypothetical protein
MLRHYDSHQKMGNGTHKLFRKFDPATNVKNNLQVALAKTWSEVSEKIALSRLKLPPEQFLILERNVTVTFLLMRFSRLKN